MKRFNLITLVIILFSISPLTASAAPGNNNIGNSNQGSGNIGNDNQGNGNIGNNNIGDFNLGENNDSLADLQEKAAQGDPVAQLELADKYLYAEGVSEDSGTAIKWAHEAVKYAEKNHSSQLKSVAFDVLGMAYEDEGGVKNIQEAIKWYSKSAMLNDPRGMEALSRIYFNGEGVPRDVVLGLAWMYVTAGSGAPGTVDNSGIKLAISSFESKAGADAVLLAWQKCSELTAKIKK